MYKKNNIYIFLKISYKNKDKMLWLEAKIREFEASRKYFEQKQKRAGLHSEEGRGSVIVTGKKKSTMCM